MKLKQNTAFSLMELLLVIAILGILVGTIVAAIISKNKNETENLVVTPRIISTNQIEKFEPFTVTSKGTFKAGYDNTVREIIIIKDNKTGVEYLAITDCSLIKRVNDAKQEALEKATEMVIDVSE